MNSRHVQIYHKNSHEYLLLRQLFQTKTLFLKMYSRHTQINHKKFQRIPFTVSGIPRNIYSTYNSHIGMNIYHTISEQNIAIN